MNPTGLIRGMESQRSRAGLQISAALKSRSTALEGGAFSRAWSWAEQRKKYFLAALLLYVVVMTGVYGTLRQFSFVEAAQRVRRVQGGLWSGLRLLGVGGDEGEADLDVHPEDAVHGHTGEVQ